MIKRTLFFGNPAYLKTKDGQICVQFPDVSKSERTIPLEDIGMIVLEHGQITITNGLLTELAKHGVAVVNCNAKHMPNALMLPMQGHTEQSERFRTQLEVSVPLKKNLWQQTIKAKITNQAAVLKQGGVRIENMLHWAGNVTSGDSQNHEARAAAYYWKHIFPLDNFLRHQNGAAPNNLLNYGYAILRAITARAIVSSGLHPTLGIFHKNKYNAFCLADDIMEPYRPYVDRLVLDVVKDGQDFEEFTIDLKQVLLKIPALDVVIDGRKSPLMVAMSRTTNSLYECFSGLSRKIIYPEF
jgi:CRISPR-associated protein Cas1